MRPKVLYTITRAEHGGAQTHLLELIGAVRSDLEPVLATGEEGFLTEQTRALGLPVHLLPSLVHPIRPHRDARAVAELYRLIRREKPDLVHAHSGKAGLIARLAAALAGVPAVFTDHGWSFYDGSPLLRKTVGVASERFAAILCERIIVVSEAERALALRYRVATPGKLTTIYNGVRDTPHRASHGSGTVHITMVARFAPPKDQAFLLRALATIDHPFSLSFVGDGPTLAANKLLARDLGLLPKTKFLGVQDKESVAKLLAASDFFVLSTSSEAFGLSALEAMRAGLPVIASSVGGLREVVRDGETGFLVAHGDAEAWTERLSQMIADADLRARLGSAGRQRYETHFTFARMVERTLTVYRDVLATCAVKTLTPV